jgi:hypothetical protein
MIVRLRIYEAPGADHGRADAVFYELVKPVHERHGARFLGRYRDAGGRVVVLWSYDSEEALRRIQQAVAQDPETLLNRERRLQEGLHGAAFTELILRPTGPAA